MRSGLLIRGHRGAEEVKVALIRFAKWIRTKYDFPIRVPVYLLKRPYVITVDDKKVSASFFAPFDLNTEPYIRIATGDYNQIKIERGRDNALASYIISLSHEIIHYQQWIKTGKAWERGVSQQALSILNEYMWVVDYP